jgi:addiction module RelE/StbE family toxin
MRIIFAPNFLRQLKRLQERLQEEALEAIGDFEVEERRMRLKIHKLHGRFSKQYSLSVNYKYRIIFEYAGADTIHFLAIGDHEVYK